MATVAKLVRLSALKNQSVFLLSFFLVARFLLCPPMDYGFVIVGDAPILNSPDKASGAGGGVEWRHGEDCWPMRLYEDPRNQWNMGRAKAIRNLSSL